MRASSIFVSIAALSAQALAWQSTAVPVQQIGDGQIQNPATPPPPAPSSAYNAPPPAGPSSVYNAPPPAYSKPAPSGGGVPPSYGNVTAVISKTKTNTATVIKPTSAPAPVSAPAPPSSAPASPTASKPAVQTANSANTLVGSTLGLGFAALLAAYLG